MPQDIKLLALELHANTCKNHKRFEPSGRARRILTTRINCLAPAKLHSKKWAEDPGVLAYPSQKLGEKRREIVPNGEAWRHKIITGDNLTANCNLCIMA